MCLLFVVIIQYIPHQRKKKTLSRHDVTQSIEGNDVEETHEKSSFD